MDHTEERFNEGLLPLSAIVGLRLISYLMNYVNRLEHVV
jgi:hypothetical protein